MSRQPKTEQAEPTAPRPRDAAGHELDAFNLPLSGPARAAALEALGKPDPDDDPEAWAAADTRAAAKVDAIEELTND